MLERSKKFANRVSNQIDAVAGKMTVAVLFGKFTGDLVAYYLALKWPKPMFIWVGWILAVLLVVFWVPFERTYLKDS